MAAHLFQKSNDLFRAMVDARQARAAAQPADPRSSAKILADIDARLARPAPLPSLTSALAARRAMLGAHEVSA